MANDFNIADGPQVADGTSRTSKPGQLILADDGTNLQTVQCLTDGTLKVNLDAASTGNQHVVDSADYTPSVSKATLVAARVIDVDARPSLTLGKISGVTCDVAGNLNVRLSSDIASTPNAAAVSDYVKAGKGFRLSVDVNQATSNTHNPLILLRNPNGSGKTLYLYRVRFGVNVTNVASKFVLWTNPTVTNVGTAANQQNTNIGSGVASVILATTLPTVSSPGTRFAAYYFGQNSPQLIVPEDFSVFLQPNQSILFTGAPSSNNREGIIDMTWVEV